MYILSVCLLPPPHLPSWLDEGECEGEIWEAIKGAWMGIIPRLIATTEDHAPMSIRGIQNTALQRSSYHVSCHMSCYGVIVW